MNYDVIIVGAGPAGMTAAIYTGRAGKTTLLLEKESFGGQIVSSDRVENYPGVPDVNGYDLADRMMEQVRAQNVPVESAEVTCIRRAEDGFEVLAKEKTYRSRAVIFAAGLRHRRLEIPGEAERIGKGVSFCAVCDGRFFRGREVAVVGGGNTAVEDAIFLASVCKKVYLIHRRRELRAEAGLCNRLFALPNVGFLPERTVSAVGGEDGKVSFVTLRDVKTGTESKLPVSALFEAIGSVPCNEAVRETAPLDEEGFLLTDEDCAAPVPGLFAAGDCRRKRIRQLTTAVADGTVAALSAVSFLDGKRE